MSLEKIMTIYGKPGLFKVISQSKNGFIVKTIGGKKIFTINSTKDISTLDDILIYTKEGEISLSKVLKLFAKEKMNKETISHKSSEKELLDLFEMILPNYNRKKVYISNIRKVVNWYNILAKDNFDFSSIIDEKDDTADKL